MRQRLSRSFALLLVLAGVFSTSLALGCRRSVREVDYCRMQPDHCIGLAAAEIEPQDTLP